MKKLSFLLLLLFAVSTSALQAQDTKTKVKKTSTIPQKVHNTVSKDKKYSGYKTKKESSGKIRKHKVNYKKGTNVTKTKAD